jgi:hypothetical protein
VFVAWLAFLALYLGGDSYCYDPETGRRGIDAFGHCAAHDPFGLPLTLSDNLAFWSFAVVPLVLAALWWPYRPWRRRA